MTPDYDISIGGESLSAAVRDRLIRLSFTDEAGFNSDEVSFDLDNRDYIIAIPAKGVKLTASLGYTNALTLMGVYVVDEVSSAGGTAGARVSIKAKAFDMLKSIKVKKTRAWADVTLGEVVSAIAGEHGYEAAVGAALADIVLGAIPYPQVDQTAESDFHFLTRLATQYDATFKIADGRLVFIKTGEGKSATGEALPVVALTETDVSTWRVTAPDRERYEAATAPYMNAQTQERETITAGGGEPIYALQNLYPDKETALAAAEAKLTSLQRGNAQMSVSMSGNAEVQAERIFTFETRDPLAAGRWLITRVTHSYSDGGFTTNFEAETPSETGG